MSLQDPVSSPPIGLAGIRFAGGRDGQLTSVFVSQARGYRNRPARDEPAQDQHASNSSSIVGQCRAAALIKRAERLVAGDGCNKLDEIPFALRLLGRLDLHQIDVVHHAAVRP